MKRSLLLSLIFVLSASIFTGELPVSELYIITDGLNLSLAGGITENNGLSASFFNPAALNFAENKFNARANMFLGYFKGAETQNFAFSANPFKNFFLGLSATMVHTPSMTLSDGTGFVIEENWQADPANILCANIAYRINDIFSAGFGFSSYAIKLVTVDLMTSNINDYSKDYAYSSFGITANIKGYRLGLSTTNILSLSGDESAPVAVSLMAGKRFLKDAFGVNFIFQQLGKFTEHNTNIGLGAEYTFFKMLSLRFSYFKQNDLAVGLNFGLGFKYKMASFDYTFSVTEYEPVHYFSLGFSIAPLGGPAPADIVKKEKVTKKPPVKKLPPKKETKEPEKEVKPKTPPTEKMLVAVLDFEGKNISKQDAEIITDFIRQEMINSDFFKLLERGAINDILGEVNFQQSGCTSAECAVQIGKILAVRKMVVGNVSQLGKKYFVTLRMVDVETSEVEVATSISVEGGIEDLPSYMKELVDKAVEALYK